MAHSVARNVLHLVFSTKNREPLIVPELRESLFGGIASILNASNCPAFEVGGVADHVHVLFSLPRTLALSKAVEQVKKESSKWAKENGGGPGFFWQNGYAAFSVSRSVEPQVCAYIRNQERHHRRQPFRDELRELLTLHGIEVDEADLWD